MGDFLTAVSTISLRTKPQDERNIIEEVSAEKHQPHIVRKSPTSADEVLHILRSHPDEDAVIDLLLFLNQQSQKTAGFEIKSPTPSSAKVINELINTTLPDFWDSSENFNRLVLECLRSVAGIGAILARLRLLTSQHASSQQSVKGKGETTRPLADVISIFSQLLSSNSLAQHVLADIDRLVENQAKRILLWKEFLTLVGTGKIVAAVAEAEDMVKSVASQHDPSWLSDGSKYSAWLGRNVCTMMQSSFKEASARKTIAQLCGKALGMGYPGRRIEHLSHLSC